ncbi:nucleoside hydrolase [Actinosynnema sp. CA-248983]
MHGNLPAEPAAQNALRVLELAGLGDVPVAVGADRLRDGSAPVPELSGLVVHGPDGLGGRCGPAPARRPVAGSAAEQLVRLARARSGRPPGHRVDGALRAHPDRRPRHPIPPRRASWTPAMVGSSGVTTPP